MRIVPWAAKRVRRRSSGYVIVVPTVPANAPEMKELADGERCKGESGEAKALETVR